MKRLLQSILDAHGGLARWNSFDHVNATIVTDGEFWKMKSVEQDQDPRRLTVKLHEQHAVLAPFGSADWRLEFAPRHVAIRDGSDAALLEARDPRASFAGHDMHTAWDPLQRAYFSGYALWTYLATPFLLAQEGVELEEIAPWTEAGERWRVVRARFPAAIATHSTIQDFFVGDDFLLRRHDYSVDVAGGFDAAQLVSDYIASDGILLPSKRRAYTRGQDGRPVLDPLMVAIDISEVNFG